MFDNGIEELRLDVIRMNVRKHMAEQGIKTPYALSLRSDTAKNTADRFLSGGGLSMANYFAFEEALGLGYGELMRDAPAATLDDINALFDEVKNKALYSLTDGPPLEEFLQWYQESGGNITPDNRLLKYLDVYAAPKDEGFYVQPVYIGASSPMARALGTDDPKKAMAKLSEANREFVRKTAEDHHHVLEGNSILDVRDINQSFIDGTIVTSRVMRSLKVGRFSGAPVVLHFGKSVE